MEYQIYGVNEEKKNFEKWNEEKKSLRNGSERYKEER